MVDNRATRQARLAMRAISGRKFSTVGDLSLKFYRAAISASTDFSTPNGAMVVTGRNAKLPHCVALEPVVAIIPA